MLQKVLGQILHREDFMQQATITAKVKELPKVLRNVYIKQHLKGEKKYGAIANILANASGSMILRRKVYRIFFFFFLYCHRKGTP